MRRSSGSFVILLATLAMGACRDSAKEDARPVQSIAPETVGSNAPSPLESYAASELSNPPLELLKLQFTTGVKQRDPVDKLAVAHPGDVIYAHLTVRNRSGHARKVHLAFSVNGKDRTELDLDVAESWSYRTWGRNTILKTDKPGELTLSVTDDEGNPLADEKLPIATR